jgi:hypothetical protein
MLVATVLAIIFQAAQSVKARMFTGLFLVGAVCVCRLSSFR